uniref:Retrotransposon protein, putative, Ty1-copia subclass n=1 Tax=Tanacetum cinerariifolium TaxID=118510 RepID=A0A699GRI5_TANCI|nr:hypothetical protein [Tanacetum cinerariifolium]
MAARGKNRGKGKNKKAYAPNPNIPPLPKREDPAKDSICHKCASGAGGLGIFVIEINTILNRLWIYDTGCGTHICNTTQGLRASRKLKLGDGLLDSTGLGAFEKCVSFMSRKMARKPYTHQVERAKDLLGLIHTDVYGPFKFMSRQGASYFVTFTHDFSCYGYVYLLKHKHEVFENFKVFQKEVENQLERRNRTLLDMVQSMMSQTTLPKSFWGYALQTTARILNMVPTKKVEKTPYEVWHGQARYPKELIGYSFYYPPENKVLVARNAKFLENSHINKEASGSLKDLEIIQEEDTHPSIDTSFNHEEDYLEIDEPQSDTVPIRRSTRTRHALDFICLYIDVEEHELGDLGEPINHKAALLDPEFEKWLNAINVEMNCLFKKKTDMDGVLHTYKAHLVEKGYTQTLGIDCSIMYAVRCTRPVVASSQNVKSRFQQNLKPEYIAAFDASKEAVWVRKFIFKQGVVPTIEEPISMYYDNTAANAIANESGITKRARHFHAKVHYLHEVI